MIIDTGVGNGKFTEKQNVIMELHMKVIYMVLNNLT